MTDSQDILDGSVRSFVTQTAARTPTPGGGSVAGVVAAMAAALGEMALGYSRGKKSLAAHAEAHDHLAARLSRAREMCLAFVAEDMAAYGMYAESAAAPEGPDRDQARQLALAAAIDVPRELAKLCVAILEDLQTLSGMCAGWLVSDLAAGATLAHATTILCDLNVRANLRDLDDAQASMDIRLASAADRRRAGELAAEVEAAAAQRLEQ